MRRGAERILACKIERRTERAGGKPLVIGLALFWMVAAAEIVELWELSHQTVPNKRAEGQPEIWSLISKQCNCRCPLFGQT